MPRKRKFAGKPIKTAGKKTAARPQSREAAEARLHELIAEREREVTDGGLQVAMAIALTSNLVTVDTSQTPFAVDPPDLGERTFSDPKVGISNAQMTIFKANLQSLLPEIADDIAEIPEDADLRVGDVAEFVRLSLLRL